MDDTPTSKHPDHHPAGFDDDGRPFDCVVDGQRWPCGTAAAHARFQRAIRIADKLELHQPGYEVTELIKSVVDPKTWEIVEAIQQRHESRAEVLS